MALLHSQGRSRKQDREVELEDLEYLVAFGERISTGFDLSSILHETLQAAAAIGGASMGLLSLYRETDKTLELKASFGFDERFLPAVRAIPLSGMASGACGACYVRGERVVVEDTESDPVFEPFRDIARGVGFRTVHSTPLIGRDGAKLGVLSTHFPQSRRPSERETHLTNLCARLASDAIQRVQLFEQAQGEIEERRRAEAALREKEALLSLVYDNTSDGLYLAVVEPGNGFRFLTVNQTFLRLSGYRSDQVIGRRMEEIVPSANHNLVREKYQEAIARREAITYCETAQLPAGRRHAEITIVPVFAGDGPVTHLMGSIRDVTAQKATEDALRESEGRLRRLADNLPSGFIYQVVHTVDNQRRFAYVSAGVEAVVGVTPEEIVANPMMLYALIAPDDIQRVQAIEEAAFLRGGPFDCQFRMLTRFGETRWLHARSRPRSDVGGNVVWEGVAIDVTERRLAEERLEAVLASIDDHLACYDHEWRYTYINDRGASVLRKTKEELLGRSIWDVFPDAVGNDYWKRLHQAVAEQKPVCFEFYYPPYETWFENHVYPTPHGVTVYSADVTWRKRMEEELRDRTDQLADADRKKDQFIALLAHELRNPLAPLRNGLEVLRLAQGDLLLTVQAREMMERQLGHLVRLIDDLLDISRISQNKLNLRRARLRMSDVVQSAVETVRSAIDAAGHDLQIRIPEEPIELDADLTRLSQVVANLLTNSAKYTEQGGKIWLTVEREGDYVILSVRDTGIGIPAESLPRIFDMFSQVDRSIERNTGGLGIGLALVKGLAEMHGGSAAAFSDGVGQGATFVVRLPIAKPQSPRPASGEVASSRRSSAPRRILVVDDNRDAADSMAMMLRLLGDEVFTAHDGLEGFEAADRHRPEIILMDVGMPRLNGFEATRQIRQMPWGRAMTIVALTGWGQETDRQQSRAAGCDGHLVKPVVLPDLERLLDDLHVPTR
jgi:PAS domain S-box-containing protein